MTVENPFHASFDITKGTLLCQICIKYLSRGPLNKVIDVRTNMETSLGDRIWLSSDYLNANQD